MEITGQTRTELIELVRTARAIVDTGWPLDADAPPEVRQIENFLRGNMLNFVAGHLMFAAGREGSPDEELVSRGRVADGTLELLGEVMANQEALHATIETQRGNIDSLLETLKAIVVKLDALGTWLEGLAKWAGAGGKAEES